MKTRLCILLLAQIHLSAATMILPEERRADIIEGFEISMSYDNPTMEELRLIPDPFVFGREIATEEPESVVDGMSDEELLETFASTLQNAVIGYQEFGERSFLATKNYGLLRDGDTVTLPVPETPNQTASVKIINPSRQGMTLQMGELETYVPLDSNPSGVTNSRP